MIKNIFIFLLIILLSSCSLLGPVKSDYTTYVVRTVPCKVRLANTHKVLYVSPVETDPLYDTDNMAYSVHPLQVEYYAKNKWAETPANMIQPLIIKTLRDTQHFRAVTTSQNVQHDYILNTKITELRQVYNAHSTYAEFRLLAEIVNTRTGKIIATQEFMCREPMCQRNPYGGASAANITVANVMDQLAQFSARAT